MAFAGEPIHAGGQSAGLGNAFVANNSPWALFSNISGIAKQEAVTAGLGYERRYNLKSLDQKTFLLVAPLKPGVGGVNIVRYGDELFYKTMLGIGWAHAIDRYQLGIQVNYIQTGIRNYGTAGNIIVNLGGIATLNDYLKFGVSLSNLNQARYKMIEEELMPTVIKAGLQFMPGNKLFFNSECVKTPQLPLQFRAGLEYKLIQKFCLRAGITTKPAANYFGAGYRDHAFALNYAFGYHQQLNTIHNFSITYTFDKYK